MKNWPDGGMFGIKKVGPGFLGYMEHWPSIGEERAVMSFNVDLRNGASRIPVGHRAILYVTGGEHPRDHPFRACSQKFVAELEITGTLRDGDEMLRRLGLEPGCPLPGADAKWSLFRPVRYLARVFPPEGADRWRQVCLAAEIHWEPIQRPLGHEYITERTYLRLRNAIRWTH